MSPLTLTYRTDALRCLTLGGGLSVCAGRIMGTVLMIQFPGEMVSRRTVPKIPSRALLSRRETSLIPYNNNNLNL